MNSTVETTLHGHRISELPATQDAQLCIDYLLKSYPEWMLRKGGQLDRAISLSQRLSQSIQAGDVDAICHIRVNLRDGLRKMEQMFGARDLDGGLVATSEMVESSSTRRLEPKKGVALFRRN